VITLIGSFIAGLLWVLNTLGLPGLFALMLVESFGIPPLPSEVILPFAGFLLVEGAAGFTWPAVVTVAVLGGLAGALLAEEVGRWGGRPLVLRLGRRFGVGRRELDRMHRYFERYGPVTVLLCRMLPLARAYISYPAGTAEMPRGQFSLYTVVGSIPFTILLVYLGTVLGANYSVLVPYFNDLDIALVAAAVVLGLWLYLRSRRSRQETLAEASSRSPAGEGEGRWRAPGHGGALPRSPAGEGKGP
jgi:membrane protein DedA with SNARE-associated domain